MRAWEHSAGRPRGNRQRRLPTPGAHPQVATVSIHAGIATSAALLVVMTLLAYLPALRDGFIWDDVGYVTANPTLRSLTGLWQIWFEPSAEWQYYPLTFTTFWIEYHLWGLDPLGYHLVNIILHAADALLLWRLLHWLRLPGAWMAAALFAIHPIQVESVAWVTELKNVLSGLFYLGAVLTFLQATIAEGTSLPHVRWRFYAAACLLFLAALLSKTATCVLPATVLLLVWWKSGQVSRRTIALLVPPVALAFILSSFTIWMERYTGAKGAEWGLSLIERVLVAGRALYFYLATFFWPSPLAFVYPRWSVDAHVWWQYLFPAAALAAVVTLYALRQRIGSGPLVAALCYASALAPVLGLINVFFMRYSFVADRFAYLATMPLAAACAVAGSKLLERRRSAVPIAYGLGVAVLLALGGLTARRCGAYRDERTLWTDTVAKNPTSWMAQSNLGMIMADDVALDDAIAHYQEALRLKPDYPEALNNLGNAWRAQGKLDDALALYTTALQLEPEFAQTHNNLGMALAAKGSTDEAISHLMEAVRLRPDYVVAHDNLGVALVNAGKLDEAIAQHTAAVRLKPDDPQLHYNLGVALAKRGEIKEAMAEYSDVLRLQPTDARAHNNLALLLAAQGRNEEAAQHFTAALHAHPDDPEAHTNLGNVLRARDKLDEAITEYEAALRLQATYAPAHNNLGSALATAGKTAEGLAHLEEAVRLQPAYVDAHYNLATVLLMEGRDQDAQAHFAIALRLRPDYAEAHNNLGFLFFKQQRLDEAIAEYQEALRSRADFPEAHTNLAAALAAEGKAEESIAHYETALQLKPDHAAAHHGLGLLLARQGENARAIAELQTALRLNPADAEAREQLEHLRSH